MVGAVVAAHFNSPPPLQVAQESGSDGHRFKVVGVVLATRFTSTYNNPSVEFLGKDDWRIDDWRDKQVKPAGR